MMMTTRMITMPRRRRMPFEQVLWIVLPILLLTTKPSFAFVSRNYERFSATKGAATIIICKRDSTTSLLLSSSDKDSNGNSTDDSSSSSEDSIVVDDPVVQLPLLQAKLAASKSPDEKETLEGKIDNARMAGEFGVRKAQVDFYTAFSTRNLEMMKGVWASDALSSSCVHPGMASIVGRDGILESWESIFGGGAGPGFEIEPADTTIDICGSTAICKCVERINGGKSGSLEAINIYKRENASWKMTFHMACPFLAASPIE